MFCLVNSLRKYFGNVQLSGLDGGMHVVWHLPAYFPPAKEMQKIAQDTGVGVYALEAAAACDFGHKEYSERNLMFGYSSVSEKQINEGISRLATALDKTGRQS